MSQIDELRQIIVGGSADKLAELGHRIEDLEARTKDVAEVLPPAIDQEIAQGGDRLIESLTKPVSLGLKRAIRSEPEEYAEILYPVMAPSIRRAITQALSSLLLTINRSVESATTLSGIGNRFRSWRTGIPYAELALRQSLVYKVEHVYLIHRETGMLLDEVGEDGDMQTLDSDAVSAMFSAIQAFVQDSFAAGNDARLTDLKVGDHNVWVAHGHRLMLACIITGDAPEALKNDLYDTLDNIRTHYSLAISDFAGDARQFRGVDALMEPLLQIELKDIDEKQESKRSSVVWPWLLLFAGLCFLAVQGFLKNAKVGTVEHLLNEQPGIATTDVYWEDKQIVVKGLRDPDASLPYSKLESYGITRDIINLQTIPFRSLEVDMELQRFNNELELPEGVYLSEREDKIYLYGEAPITWLDINETRIRQLAADRRIVIYELSASIESVSDVIRQLVTREDWINVKMSSVAFEGQTTLVIDGNLSQNSLTTLRAVFSGNSWVRVGLPLGDVAP